jgi:zinc protease
MFIHSLNLFLRRNAMKNFRLFILLVTLVGFSFPLVQAQSPAIPMDPAVRTGKLPNGMTYYVRKNAEPQNRAELRLAVNAGSVLERDDQQGLAHFNEHMAFNGSTHFKKSELVDYLESIGTKFGAHLNAYTSFDETVYMLQMPTDDATIVEKALTVLEDWACGVSFDPNEIDKERGVVIEEWRLGQGADERMSQRYLPVLFYNSRYAERLPIGKKEILESFPHQAVKDFYNAWYRPDLMAIIAVGDFDLDKMEQMIKDKFGKIPAKNGPVRTVYNMPDHEQTLVAVETDKEAQYTAAQLFFKYPFTPATDEASYREKLKGNLITTMISKRLEEYTTKPESPFNFSFSGDFPLSPDKSAFILMGITSPEKAGKAMDALLVEGERVTRHGFINSEFERAKAEVLRNYEQALTEKDKTPSEQFASRLVDHFLNGNPVASAEWRHGSVSTMLPTITLEEVNAMARQLITTKNRVVILAGQEKAGVTFPTKSEVTAMVENVRNQEVSPYTEEVDLLPIVPTPPKPGKVAATNMVAGMKLIEWTMSNGAKVVIFPTDFQEDQISFQALSVGGANKSAEKDYYTAQNVGQIAWLSGAGRLSKAKLDKKLAGKVIQFGIGLDDSYEYMNAQCSVTDFETMLQLVNVGFTNPRVDKEGFGAFINRMKAEKELSVTPEGTFEDSLSVALYSNHPRRQPMSDAMIASFNQQKAQEILLDRFGDASDFTFIFVGNIDPDKAKPLIETWIGSIPGYARKENAKDVGIKYATGVKEKTVYKGSEPKSIVNFEFTGAFDWSVQGRFDARIMKDVLNIMLREVLREEKGGTYGVRTSVRFEKLPTSTYRFTINFGCAPENVAELSEAALTQIRSLIEQGPSEKNLQKVQETWKRSIETDRRDNSWWLDKIGDCYLYGESPSTLNDISGMVENMTAAQVKSAAAKYLNLDNYVKVVLVPEN